MPCIALPLGTRAVMGLAPVAAAARQPAPAGRCPRAHHCGAVHLVLGMQHRQAAHHLRGSKPLCWAPWHTAHPAGRGTQPAPGATSINRRHPANLAARGPAPLHPSGRQAGKQASQPPPGLAAGPAPPRTARGAPALQQQLAAAPGCAAACGAPDPWRAGSHWARAASPGPGLGGGQADGREGKSGWVQGARLDACVGDALGRLGLGLRRRPACWQANAPGKGARNDAAACA